MSFVIQLELAVSSRWYPVVRFDTAHGFAHRDVLSPEGRATKTALPVQDFNEALTWAEEELRQHWMHYRDEFLKELGHDR